MKNHRLKSWTEYYEPLQLGLRKFEIRLDDRGFERGDLLTLEEWNPETGRYTGSYVVKEITYIMRNSPFLKEGYVAMALD